MILILPELFSIFSAANTNHNCSLRIKNQKFAIKPFEYVSFI